MPRTYAQLLDVIEELLQDTGNSVWTTAELDVHIPEAITELSRYVPYLTKLTVYTTADSYDITLSAGEKHRLMGIDRAEYPVDQTTRKFHNVLRWGDVVTIDMAYSPAADEDVYLYVWQKHRLQKEVGTADLSGEIATQAAAGATSIVCKGLGTGTINKDTILTIEDDTTIYTVIGDATITANWATISIYPATSKIETVGKAITLELSSGTLDDDGETCLVNYVAGKAAISKSRSYINTINIGGDVATKMENWGLSKLAFAQKEMRRIAFPRTWRRYPR